MGEVLHGSLLRLLLQHCDFLNVDISQGSVATRLRCGGIFKYELVANLPVSLPVKEFWKSVNISGSYGQEFGVLFFFWDTVYIRYLLNYGTSYRYAVQYITRNRELGLHLSGGFYPRDAMLARYTCCCHVSVRVCVHRVPWVKKVNCCTVVHISKARQ